MSMSDVKFDIYACCMLLQLLVKNRNKTCDRICSIFLVNMLFCAEICNMKISLRPN